MHIHIIKIKCKKNFLRKGDYLFAILFNFNGVNFIHDIMQFLSKVIFSALCISYEPFPYTVSIFRSVYKRLVNVFS